MAFRASRPIFVKDRMFFQVPGWATVVRAENIPASRGLFDVSGRSTGWQDIQRGSCHFRETVLARSIHLIARIRICGSFLLHLPFFFFFFKPRTIFYCIRFTSLIHGIVCKVQFFLYFSRSYPFLSRFEEQIRVFWETSGDHRCDVQLDSDGSILVFLLQIVVQRRGCELSVFSVQNRVQKSPGRVRYECQSIVVGERDEAVVRRLVSALFVLISSISFNLLCTQRGKWVNPSFLGH